MNQHKKILTITTFRCEMGTTPDAGAISDFFKFRRVFYNPKGQPENEVYYNFNGEEILSLSMTYNKLGLVKEKEIRQKSTNHVEKFSYTYNRNRKVREEIHLLNNRQYSRKQYIYNESGKLDFFKHLDEKDEIFEIQQFEYDENDKLIRQVSTDEKGEKNWERLKEYNEEGMLINEVYNNIKEADAELTKYEYNDKGENVLTTTIDLNQEVVGTVEMRYDEEGRVLRYLSETFGVVHSKILNQIEYNAEGKAVANEYFDIFQGKVILRETLKYDENGRLLEEQKFEIDEDNSGKVTHYKLQFAYEYLEKEQGKPN